MYSYDKFSNAPLLVRNLCTNYGAYIIGGAAKYLLGYTDSCKDWDVVVPLHQWHLAQRLIPKFAINNALGGYEIIENGYVVDVWSSDLGFVMENSPTKEFYIVHPLSKFSGVFDYGFEK